MFGIFKKTKPPARQTEDFASAFVSAPTAVHLDVWQRRDEGRSELTDEQLLARLAETVAWCDSLNYLDELRSEALRPSLFHEGPEHLLADLGRIRQHELLRRNLPVRYQSPLVVTGRFMLYFPDENLADGYAQLVSGGLFDVDNLPAYDTWVSLVSEDDYPRQSARRQLLCYVPAPFIGAANAGIEGNPEACIVWLDDSDVSIRRRVGALTSRVRR